MKLFKNFKTKKQLRAEIERLKAVHERPPIIKEHVEVQKLYASYLADNQPLDMVESDVSEKYAKKLVAEEIARLIIPYIEYSAEDCLEGKIYIGILRVFGRKL